MDSYRRSQQLSECTDVLGKQLVHEGLASRSAVKLGRKARSALVEILQEKVGVEDTSVPTLCLSGMPIVGKGLTSPFFLEYKVPTTIWVQELLSLSRKNRTLMLSRVIDRRGRKFGAQSRFCHIKQHHQRSCRGIHVWPFSVEDVQRTRGGFVSVVPSFGLEQGNDEDGWPLRLSGQFGGP